MNHTKAPFRYDIVGSFLRPEALKNAREAFVRNEITAAQLEAAEDAAIARLVAKERDIGLLAVTDGEFPPLLAPRLSRSTRRRRGNRRDAVVGRIQRRTAKGSNNKNHGSGGLFGAPLPRTFPLSKFPRRRRTRKDDHSLTEHAASHLVCTHHGLQAHPTLRKRGNAL